ncbi:glycosyltransferase family 2 [Catovirus CTV1]|uniref:Glycosyltransferase family 2 n=1 Tax=Catovirus CTV1 TaxID=1977631 RepID=A0A1V0S991_9VIRU|nr:glycosyltransferase family 2 [Catovirus CTV1]
MGYYNRLPQLENTLKMISYSEYNNIEIIIVNDKSDEGHNPQNIVNKYQSIFKNNIKLININQKEYVNPCIAYNTGIYHSTGDILIVQNSEVMYIDDIIKYTVENLKENDYFSYTCVGSDSFLTNQTIGDLVTSKDDYLKNYTAIKQMLTTTNISGNTIKNVQRLGYLNHKEYLPTLYHYCCAIYRKKMIEIGGFDSDYKNGICFDDNDIVKRIIKKNCLNVHLLDNLTLHQYHDPSVLYRYDRDILWMMNQEVFNKKMAKYAIDERFYCSVTKSNTFTDENIKAINTTKNNSKDIPKKLHIYLHNEVLTKFNYLSLDSFIFYHSDWEIFIYYETNIDWSKSIDILKKIKMLPNIQYIPLFAEVLDLPKDIDLETRKQYIKFYLAYNFGGIYYDMNVFFINRINSNTLGDLGARIVNQNFMMGTLKNSFCKQILESDVNNINWNKYKNIMLTDNDIYGIDTETNKKMFENMNVIDSYIKCIDILSNNQTFGIYTHENSLDDVVIENQSKIINVLIKSFMLRKNNRYYIDMNDFNFVHFSKIESMNSKKIKSVFDFRIEEQKNYEKIYGIYEQHSYDKGNIVLNHFDIFNKINGSYVNNKYCPRKISIVFSHYNRINQFVLTLSQIEKFRNESIEIIVVDDNSCCSDKVMLLKDLFCLNIKIKMIGAEKNHINPCIAYNKGICLTEGEIIILQNPEVCYTSNIIEYVLKNVNDRNYLSFNCLSLKSYQDNILLKNNINNDIMKLFDKNNSQWYNHKTLNPTYYHFCSAITKKNLLKIRGFSHEYRDGYCYDDSDLVHKIDSLNLQKIIPENIYVIHQYHDPLPYVNCDLLPTNNPIRKGWANNKQIYENKILSNKNSKKNVPKILHTYWDDRSNLLSYLSLLSFKTNNPDWEIKVWMHQENISNNMFVNYLKNITDVQILPTNLKENLKYNVLYEEGGMWMNQDIFYVKSIHDIMSNFPIEKEVCLFSNDNSYCDDIMIAMPNTNLFLELKKLVELDHNLINKYSQKILKQNSDIYTPFKTINDCFKTRNLIFPKTTIGIKWFLNDKTFESFYSQLMTDLKRDKTVLSRYINKLISYKKVFDFINFSLN